MWLHVVVAEPPRLQPRKEALARAFFLYCPLLKVATYKHIRQDLCMVSLNQVYTQASRSTAHELIFNNTDDMILVLFLWSLLIYNNYLYKTSKETSIVNDNLCSLSYENPSYLLIYNLIHLYKLKYTKIFFLKKIGYSSPISGDLTLDYHYQFYTANIKIQNKIK